MKRKPRLRKSRAQRRRKPLERERPVRCSSSSVDQFTMKTQRRRARRSCRTRFKSEFFSVSLCLCGSNARRSDRGFGLSMRPTSSPRRHKGTEVGEFFEPLQLKVSSSCLCALWCRFVLLTPPASAYKCASAMLRGQVRCRCSSSGCPPKASRTGSEFSCHRR